MLNSKLVIKLFIILTLFTYCSANSMNLNQLITLNKDGSGTLVLMYWEKTSIVKEKNNLIGSYPFSQDLANDYYASSNTVLKGFKMDKYAQDNSFTEVNVIIGFKDINKLSLMKPMSESKVSITPTDSGDVFKSIITPTFIKSNFIDNLYTILTFSGTKKSTNGAIKNDNIEWFRSKEYLNTNKEIGFYAVIEMDKKVTTTKDSPENKEKSCGLFGLELPVIISLGFAFSKFAKRRKE